MTPEEIIQSTIAHVRELSQGDSSGHDWWHIHRVWKNALTLCQHEEADRFVVELAALLHDLDDWKLIPASDGTPVRAEAWLRRMPVAPAVRDQVCAIITDLSFKGAGVENRINTPEGRIVQDADRLDALGAVGIGRAFAYGGHKGRAMHDPGQAPQLHATFEHYKQSEGTTLNHFHEKLLLLKGRMHTKTARRIAEARHAYMVDFLEAFLKEWDGRDL
jgi:uncharacterized protein